MSVCIIVWYITYRNVQESKCMRDFQLFSVIDVCWVAPAGVNWLLYTGISGNVLIDKNADRVKSYTIWDYAEGHDYFYSAMMVDLTQPPDKVDIHFPSGATVSKENLPTSVESAYFFHGNRRSGGVPHKSPWEKSFGNSWNEICHNLDDFLLPKQVCRNTDARQLIRRN